MKNVQQAIRDCTGMAECVVCIVVDFLHETPRPFSRTPLAPITIDDRSHTFATSYEEDLYTLSGTSFF